MDDVIINGKKYVPVGSEDVVPEFGVAITTRNRQDDCEATIKAIRQYSPINIPLFVVDDASDRPFKSDDAVVYRFNTNVGIASAKNKCLELLMKANVRHLFLFDDDCRPKVDRWYEPYIDSLEPHLSHSWNLQEIYRDSHIVATHAVGGSMIYYDRKVIEAVGGMRADFGKWGCEHVNLSDRIFNKGLTSWRYQDIPEAYDGKLFYELDRNERTTHKSTATKEQIEYNKTIARPLWQKLIKTDKAFINYCSDNNVAITTYLTGANDPQRNRTWNANLNDISKLARSIKHGKLVVIHDCFNEPTMKDGKGDNIEFVKVDKNNMNPYMRRHLLILQYLKQHPSNYRVWCVDSADVEQLRDPFKIKDDYLYVGWEPSTLQSTWMRKSHPDEEIQAFLDKNPDKQLLNAGVIGGTRSIVMELLTYIQQYYCDTKIDLIQGWKKHDMGVGEMAILNKLVYEKFKGRFITGTAVTTIFKQDEPDNGYSLWRHK